MALRKRALSALNRLPPFSPILSKLMASLAGQDISFAVLGDLIEKDTVIAGNVLRVVNSAAYARRDTISSVRHSLSVLGLEKLRNMVLGMSVSRMLNQAQTPKEWPMERFNKHSAAVAILSDLLVQRLKIEYPEGAFIGGLMHDVGKLVIAIGLPSEFQSVVAMYRTGVPWTECELRTLGFTHAELSGDILEAWKLPQEICTAVGCHHSEIQPPATGTPWPLASAIWAADEYVNGMGESLFPPRVPPHAAAAGYDTAPLLEFCESAGLKGDLGKLIEAFNTEYSTVAEFYR
ncbi:MAG: HDOD domain-containing protein [Acidobacteriota bacterium]